MADNENREMIQVAKEQSIALESISQIMREQQSEARHSARNAAEEAAENKLRQDRTENLLSGILDALSGTGKGKPKSSGNGFATAILGGLALLGPGAIKGLLAPLKTIVSFFGAIKTGLAPIAGLFRSVGLTGAGGAVGFIGKIFMPIHIIISAFQGLMSAFDSSSIAKTLNKDISEITNVDRLLSGLGKFLATAVGGMIDPIFKLFGIDFSVETLISSGFSYIQKAVSEGTKASKEGRFTEFVGNIWDGIVDTFKVQLTSMGDSISSSLKNVVDGFIDWIRDADWVPDFIKSKLPMTQKRESEIQQMRHERESKEREVAQRRMDEIETRISELKSREDATLQSLGIGFQQQISAGVDPTIALSQYEAQIGKHKAQFEEQRQRILKEKDQYQTILDTPVTPAPARVGLSAISAAGARSASPLTGTSTTGDVDTDRLLNMIGKKESNNNYNALVYGTNTPTSANLTDMSLEEVMKYQSTMISRGHASTAVGKYQFIRATLMEAAKNSGLSMNDKFSPENQDRMAMYLLDRRGLSKFKRGDISDQQFAANLSKEWASIPTVTGRSFYEGIAGNRASGSYQDLLGTIRGQSSGTATPSTQITPMPSQAPAINNQRTNLEPGSLEIALRNDEPSFKKAIEEFAFNSMGKTGSPISV